MILAGDIGGTKTHLALFRPEGKRLRRTRERKFSSRDYSGLEEILSEWLGKRDHAIPVACFGIAGPVVGGRTKTTNLPWIVDAERIRRRFGIGRVLLLNDLEAAAYGAVRLPARDCSVINRGPDLKTANRAVIAAGTGLGEAVLFWDGGRHRASASEGGHTDFAPRNAIEIRLLEYLLKEFGHVSYERVLCGPGLVNLYRFLKDEGIANEPSWLAERLASDDPAKVIMEDGLTGSSPICVKALDLFVSIYGAEAGNLALKALATGGVYVGGGIAPKMLTRLKDGDFMKAFCDKGRYAALMSRIPVKVIRNVETALLGAAQYGMNCLAVSKRKKSEKGGRIDEPTGTGGGVEPDAPG